METAHRSSMAAMTSSSAGEGRWILVVRPLLAVRATRRPSHATGWAAAAMTLAAAAASAAPHRARSAACSASAGERKFG